MSEKRMTDQQAEVRDLQNKVWAAYKSFIKTLSVKEYTHDMLECVRSCDNKPLRDLAVALFYAWIPTINLLAREARESAGKPQEQQ